MEEISKSKVTVYIKPKEGFLLSVARDSMTFGMLLLCIYVSQGSAWWTLVTGLLFLGFVWAKFQGLLEKRCTTFSNEDAAVAYLNKLKAWPIDPGHE